VHSIDCLLIELVSSISLNTNFLVFFLIVQFGRAVDFDLMTLFLNVMQHRTCNNDLSRAIQCDSRYVFQLHKLAFPLTEYSFDTASKRRMRFVVASMRCIGRRAYRRHHLFRLGISAVADEMAEIFVAISLVIFERSFKHCCAVI
jgi:hypothetical protein